MVGAAIRLGPFTGGLNLASDPTAIADAELVECHNFELDIDGSLISRTPLQEEAGYPTWSERIVILCEAIFSDSHYLVGSNSSGVYYYLDGVWTVITTTFQAAVAVQYSNTVYLVPHPDSGSGGKWDPVGGFTVVAAIPKGQAAVIHKERLYVVPGIDSTVNSSRMTFSEPGDFDTWDAANFVDIGQGDGTKLIDITVFQDNILLFKNQNTYVFSYDVRPADAVVRKISLTIGVNGQYNMVNYENQVYVFHGTSVYEIINYDFNRLNTKVPFEKDQSLPVGFTFADESVFLSLLGDRLICRFYKKIYVYGLRTRTWSEWESTVDQLHFFGPITILHLSTGNEFYSGSCLQESQSVIKFLDVHTASDTEDSIESVTLVTDTFTRSVSDSWGNTDTGQVYTNTGGASTDYDVTGSKGTQLLTDVNVFRSSTLDLDKVDINEIAIFETSALATGGSQLIDLLGRYVDSGNCYFARVTITTAAAMELSLVRRVSGVQTTLVSLTTGLPTHVAATQYKLRLDIVGSRLSTKLWLASSSEPVAWNLAIVDTSISTAADVGLRSVRATGNTNANLIVSWGNYSISEPIQTPHDIECWVRTKNFDMAVSHQFKRLWWWGGDVSTSRNIIGTAVPIVVNFQVYWGQLLSHDWGELLDNFWGQLLSEPVVIDTLVPTSSGVARQFVKFNKGLRYRQINFKVELVTQGSNIDGPARLFTMTILTETRQIVPKSVN